MQILGFEFRSSMTIIGLPWWLKGKESTYSVGYPGFEPWVGMIPWREHGNPLQYSCLETPHGQKSLVGYSPGGRKEADTTERLHIAQHSGVRWSGRASFTSLAVGLLSAKDIG